ncbi:hypothetical protein FB451DRAFT_1021432 [Mycena latifolia]|nr:hypothetical protein FB451DRAFT_1021432 [Mycena latifolia]
MLPSEDKAQRLKVQGNALHEKGDYQGAYEKYTDAIAHDPTNAILYANRSASNLAMKERQSLTQSMPRPGQDWPTQRRQCFDAWETALACIPSQDLTSGQKALQAQFREGLKASKVAKANPPAPSRLIAVPIGRAKNDIRKMPWVRAAALEKKVLAAQDLSSAIVLLYASRVRKFALAQLACITGLQAIQGMTNGILIDRRCFYMDKDWGKQYIEQLKFEGEYYQAWGKGGAQLVLEQAPGRLHREGWSAVGPALCMTVRTWIMQGFLSGSTGSQGVAADYFRNALTVIEWGRETWKDVPRSDRGDIFDVLFMRSVNRLFVAAVMDWLDTGDAECPYTLQDLAKFARDMIQELDFNTPESVNEDQYHPKHPGHYAAGWIYPRADALGALGWFHLRLAKTAKTVEDKKIHLAAAARYYMESVETYPADDEFTVLFQCIALDAFLEHGTPLRHTLPICKRIRRSIPNVLEIWEFSAMAKRRDAGVLEVAKWELESQRGLLVGKFTPATEVGPSY